MRKLLALVVIMLCTLGSFAQEKKKPNKSFTGRVETSCGQCNFGLKGSGCSVAVKIDGVAYFVDGVKIDEFGDAHADDGFCNAVRKADVKGKIVNGRFKASSFRLVPISKN